MTTSIIRIGNSRGIIIPASLLRRLALSEKDNVRLSIKNNTIMIDKEDTFTGPFTGPFACLKGPEDLWGGKESDAREYAAELRKGRTNKELVGW